MLKKLTVTLTSLLLAATTFAATEEWAIDQAHSKVGFEIGHLVISSVDGMFSDFGGTIHFDADNPKKASDFKTTMTVKAESVNTGNGKRDDHLRNPDFFDVKKFPEWKFESTKVTTADGKKFKLMGKLTLHGVTKDVTFDVKYQGTATAYDVQRIAFEATTSIKREDFGLTWNSGEVTATNALGQAAEALGTIGSEVDIMLKIQAKRKADL